MADTSFRFGTDVGSEDNLLSLDDDGDCIETEEEEYDALNDETFGSLEGSTGLEDWEQQHEQFAELAESSKQSERLENSLNKLVLDEPEFLFGSPKDSVWSYNSDTTQNGDILGSSILSNVQKSFPTDSKGIESRSLFGTPTPPAKQVPPRKFCTVEDLERGLLQNRHHKTYPAQVAPTPPVLSPSNNVMGPQPPPLHHPHPPIHPYGQHPLPGRLPPSLPPMGMHPPQPPPHLRHMHHGPPNMPPGLVRLMPPAHYMQGGHTPPPGLMYPPSNPQFPVNHPYNFPFPPRIPNMHHVVQQMQNNRMNHHQQQQPQNRNNNNNRHRNEYFETQKDEHAGLMSNWEKQWLVNIQLVQLNTGTPYFDDYYYTVFKERKSRNGRETMTTPMQQALADRNPWHNNRRNSDRQENQNTLTPKVYTPLQFENSLGKLQCGSVMAPRKIIDMDIVTPDKDSENNTTSSRDTKKTKQLLLELEAFYSLMLKAEDLRNPLYKSNMEKLCEIKQKQRLRELDMATTVEQKQEILKNLRQDSEPLAENPNDYLSKVISGLFHDDKYTNFLNIRKGKMLLLRIMPYLNGENFLPQLPDLWIKVLLSVPVVGRKDTTGDNLFVRLHPYFKRFIQISDMNVILEIVSNLLEVQSPDNSRGTPISCQGKPPLNFILSNKFGVSALMTIFIRSEYLISNENASEKQQTDWYNFVVCWAESLTVPKVVLTMPLECVPVQIFDKHCDRIGNLTVDKRKLLEKWLTDIS